MIRHHVTFRTELFNSREERDYFINPGCFGDDCARWLAERLKRDPRFKVEEEFQEDWGWRVPVELGSVKFFLNVGLMCGDDPEWLVNVEERRKLLSRFFGKVSRDELRVVVLTIHDILISSNDMSMVSWHDENEFMRALHVGQPSPLVP